ncbi:MAG: hypothetical protein SNJ82_10795 [Gemmataceae bacterium]
MIWIREIAGWLLLLVSLLIFLLVRDYLEQRWIFAAGIMAFVGVIVFWGGIHLLKVAIAARIAQNIRHQTSQSTRSRER